MSFVQMRSKLRCLAIVHSIMFGENQTQPMSTNNSYQLSSMEVESWLFELVLQPLDLGTLQLLSDNELCIAKESIKVLAQSLSRHQPI